VRLEADGAALLGLTVDGSGGRFDLLDAAVRVRADDVRVEGVAIRNALFGVLVEQSRRVRVRGNEIEGDPSKPLGLRGDAIRLWEVRESLVEGNRVRHARDVVVWYSPGNRLVGNRVESGRYGTHFMYSHDNVVERNRYERNVVGIFVMYSRGIRIRQNLLALSAGAAGIGLGAKESGNLEVVENWFPRNTVGAYLDTSPLQEDAHNRFEANHFVLCDTGVVFHGGASRNRFRDNEFRDNGSPVRVEGRGDARDADWTENYWGEYAGYDLDGDGFGDVPYALRSLSQELAARAPALRLLRGSPAMALVEFVGRAVPLFQARTLLMDERPRMRAPEAG
jgi:nitrous oxidase accessory protein